MFRPSSIYVGFFDGTLDLKSPCNRSVFHLSAYFMSAFRCVIDLIFIYIYDLSLDMFLNLSKGTVDVSVN